MLGCHASCQGSIHVAVLALQGNSHKLLGHGTMSSFCLARWIEPVRMRLAMVMASVLSAMLQV